jgi:hypothetical protein
MSRTQSMKMLRNEAEKTSKVGRSIIRSLKEIPAWQRGKGAVRLVDVPDPMQSRRLNIARQDYETRHGKTPR